jgi:chromosome segregation ATPase
VSAYRLRATEIARDEREHELAREREQMAEELAMLGGLETELARAEASCDELNRQIEAMTCQLKEAGGDRARLERELRAWETDIAAGDKELTERRREIEERWRALETEAHRLSEHEQELEIQGIELAAQERALVLAIDHISEKSTELRLLEISLDARSEELDERERAIEEKLRRPEREERSIDEQIEAARAGRATGLSWRQRLVKATEKQLTQIEQDLQGWDIQQQNDPDDREGDWWALQLGQTVEDKASRESVSGGLRAIN